MDDNTGKKHVRGKRWVRMVLLSCLPIFLLFTLLAFRWWRAPRPMVLTVRIPAAGYLIDATTDAIEYSFDRDDRTIPVVVADGFLATSGPNGAGAPRSYSMLDWQGAIRWRVNVPGVPMPADPWEGAPNGNYRHIDFSRDGRTIAALVAKKSVVQVYRWHDGRLISRVTIPGDTLPEWSLAQPESGPFILTRQQGNSLELLAITGERVDARATYTPGVSANGQGYFWALAPDGKTLAVSGSNAWEYITLSFDSQHLQLTRRYSVPLPARYIGSYGYGGGYTVFNHGLVIDATGAIYGPQKKLAALPGKTPGFSYNSPTTVEYSPDSAEDTESQIFSLTTRKSWIVPAEISDGDFYYPSPIGISEVETQVFRFWMRESPEHSENQSSDAYYLLVKKPGRIHAFLPLHVVTYAGDDEHEILNLDGTEYEIDNAAFSPDGRRFVASVTPGELTSGGPSMFLVYEVPAYPAFSSFFNPAKLNLTREVDWEHILHTVQRFFQSFRYRF